jgi:hypothetical protein
LVTVNGPGGLDGADQLRTELEQATAWSWDLSGVEGPPAMSGIVEIMLTATVSVGTEMSVRAAADKVRDVVHDWRRQRLDPPETDVRTESVSDNGVEGEPPATGEES